MRAPASYIREKVPKIWISLGPILGSNICLFCVLFDVIFWGILCTHFGQTLGSFWGSFWDLIGQKRGQDEPKKASQSAGLLCFSTLATATAAADTSWAWME